MRLKRFFLIFMFVLCSLCLWNIWTKKLCYSSMLNLHIQYDISSKEIICNSSKIVDVKTDVIDLKINLHDGDICQGRLLNYQERLKDLKKLELLNNHYPRQQIISGVLYNKKHIFNISKKIFYQTNRMHFRLLNNQKILLVPITLHLNNNIYVVKTFIFKKGSYEIGIQYKIYNFSKHASQYYIYGGLKLEYDNKNYNLNTQYNNFENIAYSSDHENYKKYALNTINNQKQIHYISKNGWIALVKKYFSIAWILNNFQKNNVYITHNNQDVITLYQTSSVTILPEKHFIKRTILWFGPKIQNQMSSIAPYFDLIIDYGWFWFLSKPLFIFLNILHYFLRNWGYSIILITCIIRIFTYPLIKSQYITTLKMKLLQPEIDYIKQQFKDNRKKLNEKILTLYKKNYINPLSGLIPLLLQMPIFLALYYVLVNAIELRHAPFILWINDLSAYDPLYILPVVMGVTVFFIQITAPVNCFPLSLKEKIINFAPILFVCFFLWFPSGLVLYYTVSNIVTILQQMIIHHTLKSNKLYKLKKLYTDD